MGILKRALVAVYRRIKGPALTDEEISQRLIERIRAGGGQVGTNVDILGSKIDLGEPYLLSIGDNVTITGVNILTHDASTKKCLGYSKSGKVHIGSDVFIGNGAIILPNTTIGNKVVVGAGTVVARDIPDNSVVVGNPCRVMCSYDEYIERMKARMQEYPVIDLLPAEIMEREESKTALKNAGFGFIR